MFRPLSPAAPAISSACRSSVRSPPSANHAAAKIAGTGEYERAYRLVDGMWLSESRWTAREQIASAAAPSQGLAVLETAHREASKDPRARDALFLLGRVEELRAPGSAAAIGWYDQYLAGAPGGTYAAEALGRKMILSNEVTGPASSRPIAEEYLRRFPGGSYAGAARALQRGP